MGALTGWITSEVRRTSVLLHLLSSWNSLIFCNIEALSVSLLAMSWFSSVISAWRELIFRSRDNSWRERWIVSVDPEECYEDSPLGRGGVSYSYSDNTSYFTLAYLRLSLRQKQFREGSHQGLVFNAHSFDRKKICLNPTSIKMLFNSTSRSIRINRTTAICWTINEDSIHSRGHWVH